MPIANIIHKAAITLAHRRLLQIPKKSLPEMAESNPLSFTTIYQKSLMVLFLPRLRSSENGVIPISFNCAN